MAANDASVWLRFILKTRAMTRFWLRLKLSLGMGGYMPCRLKLSLGSCPRARLTPMLGIRRQP